MPRNKNNQPLSSKSVKELINVLENLSGILPKVDETGKHIKRALNHGGKIITAGNGGSATDALHLAEELVGKFDKHRKSLPAICLCANSPLLTCIGNDYGFQYIFSRQLEGLASPKDVLIVFTTSGNSQNIIHALDKSRELGLTSIALLGKDGGMARGKADHEIIVESSVTARIQEVHTLVLHLWLELIEGES
jgi:D-sedoheptulose 7-phosphate isomerase